MTRVLIATAAVVAALFTAGFLTQDTATPATLKGKKPTFKLASNNATLSTGGSATATVTVTPINGYKWNKDYPAKLTFAEDPKTVALAKKVFKQVKGDFKADDKKTAVPVTMKGAATGQETLKGQMKFSVCNETACVIEKADVQIAVSVSP